MSVFRLQVTGRGKAGIESKTDVAVVSTLAENSLSLPDELEEAKKMLRPDSHLFPDPCVQMM